MVLRAQKFINQVYAPRDGIPTVAENGRTSWEVMHALTRCLQYELGISSLSDNFGPGTLSALTAKYPRINRGTVPSADFCRLIQSALYCKGYDGGDIDGIYNARVSASVTALKTDMGVERTYPGDDLVPKVFKGLLTMDPYVVVNGGSQSVRSIQQWLNWRYVDRKDFFIVPCDGHHSRTVANSMLLAVQYELGMADGVANGVFGPGTRAGLKQHTLYVGSSGTWTLLFSAAMILNQRTEVTFGGTFNGALSSAVSSFQGFCELPVTGIGDFATWASLLVSYGDQTRKGTACDGVTMITQARADTLKAQGYVYVGRYLTNPHPTDLPEKAIQPGELATIARNGLRCYPIYQTYGRDADSFSYPQGKAAGVAAGNAAKDHGFKNGTRIFFAVDYDVYDYQVTDNVIPHFRGIRDGLAQFGFQYEIGVYGPRNVCTRVGEAGLSTASFVSDMSSGFSGNYGYALPSDWAYDQIVTIDIGSGAGHLNIDNNIASGRDRGQGSFDPPRVTLLPDTRFDAAFLNALFSDVGEYMRSIGHPDESVSRIYSHQQCLETVMAHDALITDLSHRYSMRKSLIQTSTYWEMRHYDYVDLTVADAAVVYYHTGAGGKDIVPKRDSSTGIAQMSGTVGILAWNHCVNRGLAEGPVLDHTVDDDLWVMWQQLNQENSFSVTSVALAHIWGAAGKPGGSNPPKGETTLRTPRLDYTEHEIYELLRRYQGWGDTAEKHAKQRMPLYQIFETYNRIVRRQ
ncbi:glycoside hydrolase domain-containing protein [Streptomyces sp. TRM 70351]|uniref:glycoside hydrolase domain-containing protein n=1 Tax=Streptomyces sp. TRM 70351 TaxID=3116552 RepID=UPI002E7B90E1|nr:glycoside hydrolase domain-containing protein [Streptomyces sp. TRM 70351]MEE1928490.1 glycoside hydrolase domain-containing protein [Streptomyces sp. TRM 70351]